jgi:hypothetical protein
MTEGNKALFDRYVERESVLLFFSKNDGQEKTIILSKSLPKNLFKAVLIDYAEDLDFKLNENK